jgi:hypothetical protein
MMKTGGTSLHMLMRSWFQPDERYPSDTGDARLWEKILPGLALQARAVESKPRRFYSVHMPAWVAEEVAPEHVRITVLRDPVARTVSHLQQLLRRWPEYGSLEEIYDDPVYTSRLTNYQVRMLSSTKEEDMPLINTAGASKDLDPLQLPAVALRPQLATAVGSDQPVPDRALGRALATLETFDFVGVTDHLSLLASRLTRQFGMTPANVGHEFPGSGPPASASLLERIRYDNAMDAELYERARVRALEE